MEENIIKALLTLDTKIIEGTKYILVPLEDILRKKVSIQICPIEIEKEPPFFVPDEIQSQVQSQKKSDETPSITIIAAVSTLYRDADKMTKDVTDYLTLISRCWEYKSVEFKTSILKKAASYKPTLNTVMFGAYGKESDKHLTELVESNLSFIKDCWEK